MAARLESGGAFLLLEAQNEPSFHCLPHVLSRYHELTLCDAPPQIDFFIDGDMIHIADTKVAQRYGDFFIRQIHKLEDLNLSLRAIKV